MRDQLCSDFETNPSGSFCIGKEAKRTMISITERLTGYEIALVLSHALDTHIAPQGVYRLLKARKTPFVVDDDGKQRYSSEDASKFANWYVTRPKQSKKNVADLYTIS